jgi:Spy/CpxP family protein refolding chaperone
MMLFLFALLLPPPGPPEDPIGAKLYPPELIMAHQQELGIDDKQREAIVKEVQNAQSTITKLSWQMQAEAERMGKLLDSPKVDEKQVLAQADKVMNIERDVKKAHLTLLIRLKNLLTDAQRQKLAQLRKQSP